MGWIESGDVIKKLSEIESHDLVKVVRCKDCMFYSESWGKFDCDLHDIWSVEVTPESFCSWGEERV